jgi:glycine cleavage system transcriptional repressor
MKKFLILNLVGKDQPGIVDEVTKILVGYDANIEDSRMAALGGCFSIMALFSCKANSVDDVNKDLKNLNNKGFTISLHEATDPALVSGKKTIPLEIEVQSMDHPGIVQELVRVLHQFELNILSLDTHVTNAPLSGDPLFNLFLKAELEDESSVSAVQAEVEKIAKKMDLDLKFITG